MSRRQPLFRPTDQDDQDAPPPYEATATTTVVTTTLPSQTYVAPHEQYPVLDTSQQDNDTRGIPPPPVDYFPAMATAPSPTTPTATYSFPSFPHYPAMPPTCVPPLSSYPAMSPLLQSYPTMPFHEDHGEAYPVPVTSSSYGSQFPQYLPSAPPMVSNDYSSTFWEKPSYAPPPSPPPPLTGEKDMVFDNVKIRPTDIQSPEHNDDDDLVYQKNSSQGDDTELPPPPSPPPSSVTIQTRVSGPITTFVMPAQVSISTPILAPMLAQVSIPTPILAPMLAQVSIPTPVLTPMAVPLVTTYKCRKCGAILESETAVCRRMHALGYVENFVQNATRLDLEGRRKYGVASASPFAAAAGPGPGPNFSYGNSSLSPNGPSYNYYQQQQQQQQQQFGFQGPTFPQNDGTNTHYPGYHNYQPTRRSEDNASSNSAAAAAMYYTRSSHPTPAVENESNGYLGRPTSMQSPMTTLKKFWRDTKNEIKYSKSQRSSVQHEIVAPPPLPCMAGNSSSGGSNGHDGNTSSSSSSSSGRGLTRSNTCTMAPTPAYNPAFVSP